MTPHICIISSILIGLAAGSVYACNDTITPDPISWNNPDIHGVAVYLPIILENPNSGPFPDLLKTINKYYPEGTISISIEPVKRVYLDVNNKNANFRFPIMKVHEGADNFTPYQFSKEMLGMVSFVIYTFKEEADYIVKKYKLNQLRRAHFDDYPDVLFVSCNKRGDFVNAALSKAIIAARASGELQKAYSKVHKPYQDWQPQ